MKIKFENRCVLKKYVIVMRPIFDNTYKGEIYVEIYMRALHHELVLLQQSRNCFCYVPANDIEEYILGWNPSEYNKEKETAESKFDNFEED